MSSNCNPLRRLAQVASLVVVALAASAGAVATDSDSANSTPSYTIQTLDYPGASGTIFWGLNDFGELGGEYHRPGFPPHAMIYRHGQFESLDPNGLFGDRFSAAGTPTDLGTLIADYADASGLQHGVVIQWGQVQEYNVAGHLNANVDGMNIFGEIAGVYWDTDGVYHGVASRWGQDTLFDFSGAYDTYPLGINNAGEIVGYWNTARKGQWHGFHRSKNGKLTQIDAPNAGPLGTVTIGINDAGQTVGYYADTANHYHSFILAHGQYQYLDVAGAVHTFANSINNLGVIAGYYYDASFKQHGFIAKPQR